VIKLLSVTAAFVFCLASVALAQSRSVSVSDAWARASNVSTGAVYLTITNSGSADDKLVAAQSPVAKTVQMHIETNDNGIMKMRQLHAVDVKASGKATLAPGGMHLMLIGLKHHLIVGQTFPLTLTFEKAGKIAVTVAVKKAGSMGDSIGGMKM
jgi:periplasmic copper chaperone A